MRPPQPPLTSGGCEPIGCDWQPYRSLVIAPLHRSQRDTPLRLVAREAWHGYSHAEHQPAASHRDTPVRAPLIKSACSRVSVQRSASQSYLERRPPVLLLVSGPQTSQRADKQTDANVSANKQQTMVNSGARNNNNYKQSVRPSFRLSRAGAYLSLGSSSNWLRSALHSAGGERRKINSANRCANTQRAASVRSEFVFEFALQIRAALRNSVERKHSAKIELSVSLSHYWLSLHYRQRWSPNMFYLIFHSI